jgi:hypothetical protein
VAKNNAPEEVAATGASAYEEIRYALQLQFEAGEITQAQMKAALVKPYAEHIGNAVVDTEVEEEEQLEEEKQQEDDDLLN